METKEELVSNIKEWIKLETEINLFQKEIKERKAKMKALTDLLVDVMKKNELECVDIKGGSLLYKKNTVKKAINAKTLMTSLKSYFANNTGQAEDITKFILDNREETVKEVIKHKKDKI
jgi:hypothetical protein